MNNNFRSIAAPATGLAVGFLLLGCKGVPTKAEMEARGTQAQIAKRYRPGGNKPALPVLTTNSPFQDFLTFTMLNQPAIEAAYYEWVASIERITSARSLPDPQLTFQMDIQDIVTSVMPGLMMNFPAPGKLHGAAELTSAQSAAKYFQFQGAALEAAFELKKAFYQLYFLEEKIKLNRSTLGLLSELEELARAQIEVGKVTLQDVLRAQIERGRVQNDLVNLEDSRGPLLAQFKSALGLGVNDPPPPVPQPLESTPLSIPFEQILTSVIATNTRLKAVSAELRAAEAALALAGMARRPDFSAGLMADVKMSPILYRPVATMSLPIWRDKIAAEIAEAQAAKRGVEARLSAEEIALATDLAQKSYSYREATRNLELLQRELLPRQRQSLEVARSGYLSGQIDFFNLTDAEQTLLQFGLAEVEARSQRELALTELSLLLNGMPARPSSGSARVTGLSAAGRMEPGQGSMNMK